MTGLLLLFVAGVWFAVAVAMALASTRKIKNVLLRSAVAASVLGVLLVLPVLDELVGKQQFDSLCKKYAIQEIDEQHATNRRAIYVPRGDDRFAEGTAVLIRIDPIVYRDAETTRVLVSYHTLHAKGGWLVRALGISETNGPLLFNSGCAPTDQDGFKKKFNITVIN